ncbi:MAG: carboxypeptidase-like regulatory domain-containing protein [Cyclobacteriaceae bacterium]|nr:carboxypeptidase-like regulatory domain-containing protein [Cyclobacteriaceae bacterium]
MRNFKIWCVFVAIALSASVPAVAQSFIFISGKVVEQQSKKPVPYANIYLKTHGIGTASNTEGEFIFKIPTIWANDTLMVSSIGYNTAKSMIWTDKSSKEISLEQSIIQLKEITVIGEPALAFVNRAIKKIPQNYDTTNFHMNAYYKENAWLGDFEMVNSEAVLDIYKTWKPNTRKKFNDQLRILKGRKKQIKFPDDMLYHSLSLSNGARGNLGNDFVKGITDDYHPFNQRNFKYYQFEFGDIVQDGSKLTQIVSMRPKKKSRKGLFNMKLFIDQESMAFERIEADLTKEGVDKVERSDKGVGYSLASLYIGFNTNYDKFSADATYKMYHGKWYLNSVNRHFELLVNSRKRKIKERKWFVDGTLQITDIETLNRNQIAQGNIGNNQAAISTIIGNDYDESFWENFNVIKLVVPDSLKKTIPAPEKINPKQLDPKQGSSNQKTNHQKGFTRADTLRGKLSPRRTCYDVLFYHLDVAVNMNDKAIKGSNLIRFRVAKPFRTMQVDLFANMKVERILYKNKPLNFKREFDAVYVDFPEPLKADANEEIRIYYEGVPKTPDWSIPMNGGLLWDKDEEGNAWAQMVCQGSGASLWWPNKDHLSDEPDSMKIWITVPKDFTEISNGRLKKKTPKPENQTRYEWEVTYPINNYNVTFSIGKYAHYQDKLIANDTLTLDYYVMPYNVERAKQLFADVKPMLTSFEKYFGKYSFSRDGFTLVESLYPMEHQSGVCIGKITDESVRGNNPLMWHESAHEWWGNAVSCTDLADMWIHEAFATYAEALVVEDKYGKEIAQQFLTDSKSRILNQDPIVGAYDVNDIFYDIEDMYSKGSLVLHTFRNVLNNDARWFSLLQAIQNQFRYQTISTKELVAFINKETNEDYTYFFDQYLFSKSLPKLEIKQKQAGADLVIDYRWQSDVKDFRMPIKVTTAIDHFDFIFPTTAWKSTTIKNMPGDQFDVDENGFLITLDDSED